MGLTTGRLKEIRIKEAGNFELLISCPESAVPDPGQYLLATDHEDPHSVVGTPLFLSEITSKASLASQGFWAVPLFASRWQPGTHLDLVGPLGHGFVLPMSVQRLGLVALDGTAARLLPLASLAQAANAAITLFTDQRLPRLPSIVEVNPLASLREILDWADFIALDVSIANLGSLRECFELPHSARLPCPAQVLVTTAMPCARMAKCGACAVKARRGWKFACEDGPVFDLDTLEW